MLVSGRTRQKARRAPRACDFCHRRSIACRPSEADASRCQSCVDYDERCTSERPVKKRGVKSAADRRHREPPPPPSTSISSPQGPGQYPTRDWRAPTIASQALIVDLVEVYFEVVYPIFPFFHQPTLLRRISRGEYQTDRSLFVMTMAMCALSSARARDGAVFSGQWDLPLLMKPPSEHFFAAAASLIPESSIDSTDFNYLRAYALLSLAAIQYGQPRNMRYYLGFYHTCTGTDGLHDETNWPQGIGIVEVEERRRLFWSMYTLDVYTSIVWGGVVRSREAQANVLYPTAVDDGEISNAGYGQSAATSSIATPSSPGSTIDSLPACWLYGWNFTTDLYRILEHVVDQFRRRRPERRLNTHIDAIFGHNSVPSSAVLDAILTMYKGLPSRFKQTPPVSSTAEHRLNFQTANIAATVQLVRMMLFAAEDATVEQRCCVANELLQAFSDVPVIYLRAISSPLLHHLAGIGTLLGSVFEYGLPESAHQQIRGVLSSMVQLLADLEVGLYCTAGASGRIQTLIQRIDQYIKDQRQLTRSTAEHSQEGQDPTATTSPLQLDTNSPLFLLPPKLLEDWSWAFDFAQTGD